MINFSEILLRLCGSNDTKMLFKTFLAYDFPVHRAIVESIFKDNKYKDPKKIPIDLSDKDIPSDSDKYLNISWIQFITYILISNGYDENVPDIYKKLYKPDMWLEEIPFLSNSRNLNLQAQNGNIDPVIGRDKEILDIIQIISNRKKRNPVLIGDAGVGKTAIIEGLAFRINNQDVPISMLDITIIEIDPSEFVDSQNGLSILRDLFIDVGNMKNIILFIDEVHMLSKARTANNINLMDYMKPFLARGDISLICATTDEEYREIEKDNAMARRLQPIYITEPNKEYTKDILHGICSLYEQHHHIFIDDRKNLEYIVKASEVVRGFNPDKSITILDNILSTAKINNNGVFKNIERNDIINIITNRYKVRKEFLVKTDAQIGYAKELTIYAPIYKNIAVNIFESILDARNRGKRNAVMSVNVVIGEKTATTKLAKSIAKCLDPDKEYIYIDGSQYTSELSQTNILGAPKSYVGYGDSSKFNKLKNRSVPVIIDKYDIMHPVIKDIFEGIISKGFLETTSGENIPFRNSDIIITISNNDIDGSFVSQKSKLPSELNSISDNVITTITHPLSYYNKIFKKHNIEPETFSSVVDEGVTREELENAIKSKDTRGVKYIGGVNE